MEGSSSQLFDDDQKSSGASKFLFNLPSRGHLSSTVISSNLSQHIKTNQQNILIRSLMLNDKNGDSSSKDVKAAAEGPRKRAAERVMDSRASAKKANTQGSSQPRVIPLMTWKLAEGSSSRAAEKDYHSLTVERLRALLKERGLSSKGKKACSLYCIRDAFNDPFYTTAVQDELIARLKCVNGSSQKSE
ncbi:hypothetical protein Gohar_012205 [Gossypium harknessii]|uniref:SAP domain-containing protein n=1 Tax=Gossypium harknessii TaxID=34285 RepID=A0A7J9GW97_9ROSI|nr:hypothetical protein [Gossypium harknessii]